MPALTANDVEIFATNIPGAEGIASANNGRLFITGNSVSRVKNAPRGQPLYHQL